MAMIFFRAKSVLPIVFIIIVGNTFADTKESKSFLMGKFVPYKHTSFIQVKSKYASRKGMYLQKKTYSAYKLMYLAALKDGVHLEIRSATRSFNHQKQIWEAKWTGRRKVAGMNLARKIPNEVNRARKILRYSAMPGSSRHHWGTEVDLNSFSNNWFSYGKGRRLYKWLQKNAKKYGFCQVYTKKSQHRLTGYEEEKWHWSYMPLSSLYTKQSKEIIILNDFSGFKGSSTANNVDIINSYMLSINPACK
jgi:LAS superfamily LD-carboxypeptidase LdcB